jgi:3-oxoacyl-[acyl-carrier protein] reductase
MPRSQQEDSRVKLSGRVAFVTGAGSGLGRAIAVAFAREGARVAANDLHELSAKETLAGLPGSGHLALAGDVSDASRVAAMFAELDAACGGRLDVLVNNAGVDRTPGDAHEQMMQGGSQLLQMSDAGWTRMLEIHLNGAFFCAREAARRMIPAKSGAIINMSSIAGLAGMGAVHYATAKAGLLGMTRSLARELGRHRIRVNAICPGAIDTPMARQVPEAFLKVLIAGTPLGRIGTPEEIAATALYLASDDAGFVTGQYISPNGGIHIG